MRVLFPAIVAAVFALPAIATASNFTILPTEINLAGSGTSALVTLRNESASPLRFEITVFSWSEDEGGQMMLAPAEAVTFFPKLIELAPKASRNIRVGIGAGVAGDVERSFRLFVEELPDQTAPKSNAVAIRTKVGIPIFVRPTKPARSAVVEGVTVENGRVRTRVKNTGNLHINVETIAVRGTSGAGASSFTRDGQGWYVLPGATRVFEVPISAAECSSTASLVVEIGGHGTTIKGTGPVPAGACATR